MNAMFVRITTFCWAILTFTPIVTMAQEEFPRTPVHDGFAQIERESIADGCNNLPIHPRLLLTEQAVNSARKNIKNNECWQLYYEAIVKRADRQFEQNPVERILEGRRLLGVSRDALGRIFRWSFLYRYGGDQQYARRVEREALAIADFVDWNPSHFLDVAEMTTAMAIAYDSCYDELSASSRERIREAIWQKGVLESLKFKGGWKRNTANWNQVCWCGTLYGALAIIDELDSERRELAIDAILDSVNGITWSMSSYAPDGNYTEGPGYWAYGTSFNTLLLDALTNSFGNDFGRSDAPGFMATINYYEHVFGTTGDAFNYPDSGGGKMFEATAFWFARQLNDPTVVWNERNALIFAMKMARKESDVRKGARSMDSLTGDRLAVCALLWGAEVDLKDSQIEPPCSLGYIGLGDKRCCVALFRTAWKDSGAYLGIKCGSPSSPHGHMDEGGFVYDDGGIRWVVELGPENYHSIESRGMNLWAMNQDSDRWKILRYNNYGHSVPTVNDAMQLVGGYTTFKDAHVGKNGESSYVVIDLSPVYQDELESAVRKATLHPDGSLVIEDVFSAKEEKDAKIERRFIVREKADIRDGVLYLTQKDPFQLSDFIVKRVEFTATVENNLDVKPCETDAEFDSKNPGVYSVVETSFIPAGETATFTTRFSAIGHSSEGTK